MPRDVRQLLFVGISNSVAALDTRDGAEMWRTKLGGDSFVTVLWDGVELFATAKGEAFRLDPETGEVLWNNKLTGLGRGLATLACTRSTAQSSGQVHSAERKRQADAAGAAAVTAAM